MSIIFLPTKGNEETIVVRYTFLIFIISDYCLKEKKEIMAGKI